MTGMSNQSYLSVWLTDFTEEHMLEHFGDFLSTVPYSAAKPGLTYLTIRAVDSSESPIYEQDLRPVPLDPSGIVELATEYLHSDCAYEARAQWDLWIFDPASEPAFRSEPEPLELICYGEDYDSGAWQQNGHFEANLGFEHFFTGHAGLLGIDKSAPRAAESPEEARFLEAMAWPENLEKYQEKTRENIRRLIEWVRHIEKAIPNGRVRLWSEGEENFEARLEEILAAR